MIPINLLMNSLIRARVQDLRTKNWKLIEALNQNQASQSSTSVAKSTNNTNSVVSVAESNKNAEK